jgi:hypothetical protein
VPRRHHRGDRRDDERPCRGDRVVRRIEDDREARDPVDLRVERDASRSFKRISQPEGSVSPKWWCSRSGGSFASSSFRAGVGKEEATIKVPPAGSAAASWRKVVFEFSTVSKRAAGVRIAVALWRSAKDKE